MHQPSNVCFVTKQVASVRLFWDTYSSPPTCCLRRLRPQLAVDLGHLWRGDFDTGLNTGRAAGCRITSRAGRGFFGACRCLSPGGDARALGRAGPSVGARERRSRDRAAGAVPSSSARPLPFR